MSSVNHFYYIYDRRSGSITTSDNNLQIRLWSYCVIITEIIKKISEISSTACIIEANRYIGNITRTLLICYKELAFFDMKHIESHIKDYSILRVATQNLYNGYFLYKLSDNVVKYIKKYPNIFLYGAGKVGQGAYELFAEYDIPVKGFVVSKAQNEETIKGLKVYTVEQAAKETIDSLFVIAVASSESAKEMEVFAQKCGAQHCISLCDYI